LLVGPSADTVGLVGRDVVGLPSLQNFTSQFLIMSQPKENIARGMTFIAVAERGREIGTAIPHIGFALRLLKARLTQEQNVPEAWVFGVPRYRRARLVSDYSTAVRALRPI
jgi:hypothetical protein